MKYDEEMQERENFQNLFHCDECPVKFTLLNSLRTHKRMHTEISVDSCNICRKLFMHNGELDQHKEKTIQLSVEYFYLKIFKDERVEERSFDAKQKQNFIFEVF